MRTTALVLIFPALLAAEATAQTRVGDFFYVPGTDAMTDRDLSYIATNPVSRANEGGDAQLTWRCSGSTMELVLYAEPLEGLVGPTPVRWRFDQSPPSERELWRATTLEPSAYAPERTIYPFTDQASRASTVLFRVADVQGKTFDYRFSMNGLNNGLNRLACTRHLEVLGQRHAAALVERAASDFVSEPLSPEEISRLSAVYPYVGHRRLRRYTAASQPCWQTTWGAVDVIFFRSEQEAVAEGFARDETCITRGGG